MAGFFGEVLGRIGRSDAAQKINAVLTKQDDLDRAVRLMASTAYADGTADPDEVDTVVALAKEMFPAFGEAVVEKSVTTALASHKTAVQMGFLGTKRALEKVESDAEKEALFTAAYATAARTGGVGKAEYERIKWFADQVRFDLRKIGLEGPDPESAAA
jgi:tellurite resistance protein